MLTRCIATCEQDEALPQKINANQQFAVDQLKVGGTPTFFVNGEQLKGSMSVEQLDMILVAFEALMRLPVLRP